MDNKNASHPRQQECSQCIQSNGSIPIVPDQKPIVKPAIAKAGNPPHSENAIQRLRLERHIPVRDMVEMVQTLYPGYDRFLHSKVDNGAKYGVRLRADAERLLLEHFAEKPKKTSKTVHRSKPCRITARLSEPVFEQLQRHLQQTGQTAQDFLEGLVSRFFNPSEGTKE